MAYHFNADGNIPNTAIGLQASYDKTGKGFENNTLPVTLNGTEQYKLAGKNDFFRSRLTVGVDYYYLVQSNFASRASSKKWGFNVKTNFKRLPNIAISYKPFTTFRSYTDTLNVPQRPMLGSVWTGKVTYQIREHEKSLRFVILYNRSMTTMDSIKNGSSLLQASTIYSNKYLTASINVGKTKSTGTGITDTSMASNINFLSLSSTYILNKTFSVSGGQDFGTAPFGFCRYSANGGVVCHFRKKPFITRVNIRYNTFKLTENEPWKRLYSGNLEFIYRFKTKMEKKINF